MGEPTELPPPVPRPAFSRRVSVAAALGVRRNLLQSQEQNVRKQKRAHNETYYGMDARRYLKV